MTSLVPFAPSAAAILVVSAAALSAQQLVLDVNPSSSLHSPSSNPRDFEVVQGVGYFAATRVTLGDELWRTDGTAVGTRLVRDLVPGQGSGAPHLLTAVGSRLFFAGTGADLQYGLWVSDGTEAGTTRLAVINAIHAIADLGGRAVVASSDGLWVSDGTPAGTALEVPQFGVTEIAVATTVLGSRVWFAAYTTSPWGLELFVSDGTAAGTTQLTSTDVQPHTLTAAGDRIWFNGLDPAAGREPWISDGTAAGTHRVADLEPGLGDSSPSDFARAGSRVCFRAGTLAHGTELWGSDGTAAGTAVLDLETGAGGTVSVSSLQPWNGCVWFAAIVPSRSAHQDVYRTDGTLAGTVRAIAGSASFAPGALAPCGSSLFLANGVELWKSDGTTPGTLLLSSSIAINGLQDAVAFGANGLLFAGWDWANAYYTEPCISDGTPAGTRQIVDLNPPAGAAGVLSRLIPYGGHAYFAGDDGSDPWSQQQLWRTDGSAAGTVEFFDFGVGSGVHTGDDGFVVAGGLLWFAAYDQAGHWLWRTDGTLAGTQRVAPEVIGPLAESGGRVVYVRGWASAAPGIYTYDPLTATETRAFDWLDVNNAVGLMAGGRLFAQRNHPTNLDLELWSTDGTPGSAALLATSAQLWPLGVAGSRAYYAHFEPLTGCFGVLGSDGTLAGTALTGCFQNLSGPAAALGASLIFGALDQGELRIHRLDPGASGPALLASNVEPWLLTAAGGKVYGSVGLYGWDHEPWVTDGTPSGSRFLVDPAVGGLNPSASSSPGGFTDVGSGVVLFAADDGVHGRETWRTDGTAAGTFRVGDVALLDNSADPESFVRLGNLVLLTADDGLLGRELYAVDLQRLGFAFTEDYGQGCSGTGGILALTGDAPPALGATLRLRAFHARPSSPAAFLVSALPNQVPIGGGCSIYVDPGSVFSLPAASDGTGQVRLAAGIGTSPSLLGLRMYFQAVVVDPLGAWNGLVSFSNGVRVTVGR